MVTRFNMETARAALYRKTVVQGCNLPRATKQSSIFQNLEHTGTLKEDRANFDPPSRSIILFPAE